MSPTNAHGVVLFGRRLKVFRRVIACALFVTLAAASFADEPPDVDDLKAGMKARLTDVRQGLVRYTVIDRKLPHKRLEDPQEFQRQVDQLIDLNLSRRRGRYLQTGQSPPKKLELPAAEKEMCIEQVTRMKVGSQSTDEILHAWDNGKMRVEEEEFLDPAIYYKPSYEHRHTWMVDDMKTRVDYSDRSSEDHPYGDIRPSERKGWEVPRFEHPLRWPTLIHGENLYGLPLDLEEKETRFDKTAWWVSTKWGKSTYRVLISPEHSYMMLEFEVLDADGRVVRSQVKNVTESNGVHFPTKVVTSWFNDDGSLSSEEIIEVHEVALNTAPDEKLFEAVLPEGTKVNDWHFDPPLSHVVGKVTAELRDLPELSLEVELEEPTAVEANAEAEKPAAPPAQPIAEAAPPAAEEEAGGSGRLLFAIAAALVVLVLVVLVGALVLAHNRERAG